LSLSGDVRYWLCNRLANRFVAIERCLDDVGLFEHFEDIATQSNGTKGLTVFKEEKQCGQSFQPATEDTIIIFCKLFEAGYEDPSYLGHALLSNRTECFELQAILSQKLDNGRDWDGYQICLEQENPQMDVLRESSTLDERGVYSGAVLIVKPLEQEENAGSEKPAGHHAPELNDGDKANKMLGSTEKREARTGKRCSDHSSTETGEERAHCNRSLTPRSTVSYRTTSRSPRVDESEDSSLDLTWAGSMGSNGIRQKPPTEPNEQAGSVQNLRKLFEPPDEGKIKQPSKHGRRK